jgi:hypothetical protein
MSDPNQNTTTWYPGVGADRATRDLNELVGQITANWAGVEDGLFNIFVVALNGTFLVKDLRPLRAVFFTFSAYEGKMRMVNNAIKARFAQDQDVLDSWKTLKSALDGFAALRNQVAHLVPMARSTLDQNAPANVRLVPPFWKSGPNAPDEFDTTGFSLVELWQALGPFWGYHPLIGPPRSGDEAYQLSYRVQEFAKKIDSDPRINPARPPAG